MSAPNAGCLVNLDQEGPGARLHVPPHMPAAEGSCGRGAPTSRGTSVQLLAAPATLTSDKRHLVVLTCTFPIIC